MVALGVWRERAWWWPQIWLGTLLSFPCSWLCGATCAEALALHCFWGGGSRAERKPWGFRGLSLEPVCPGPSSDSQPAQRQGWTPQGGEESPRPCFCRRSPASAVTCIRCPPCTLGSTFLVSALFPLWVSGALGSVGLSLVQSEWPGTFAPGLQAPGLFGGALRCPELGVGGGCQEQRSWARMEGVAAGL